MQDNEIKSEETTKVDDAVVETPTESINNNGASENSDTSKTTENVNEVEFTDTQNDKTEEEKVKAQQINSENARKRREEKRQAELKRARYDAIKETIDGVNPFTNKPIEDDIDIEEYLAMKEIKKQGGDPLIDYSKHLKTKQKEQAESERQKAEHEEWLENDYRDFRTKHPKVDLNELAKDKSFELFATNLVGKKPMSEIYDSYQNFVNQVKREQGEVKARELANAKASPGSLTSTETDSNNFFTFEEVNKMSREEVHKHYEKIMASMPKWQAK